MRLQRVILAKSQLAAVIWGASLTMTPSLLLADERPAAATRSTSAAVPTAGLESRIGTYQHADGQRYFVATLQPAADTATMTTLRKLPASVAIVVDTSASQVGDYRNDELKALEGILAGLRPSDEVQLFAADVSTTALSKRFFAKDKQVGGSCDAASPLATGQHEPDRGVGHGPSIIEDSSTQRYQERHLFG